MVEAVAAAASPFRAQTATAAPAVARACATAAPIPRETAEAIWEKIFG